jgi:16S rRNA (cytosine967-C5)-methyltransferase
MKPDTIDIIGFFEKLSDSKNRGERKGIPHVQKPKIIHYTYEFLRNWNRINVIFIHISKNMEKPPLEKTLGFFLIYRVKWENATQKELLNTLSKLIFKKNQKDHFLQNKIIRFIEEIKKFSWEILFSRLTEDAILSLQTATPTFVIDRLRDHLPYEDITANLEEMYKPISEIKHTLRLNELRSDQAKKKQILEMLESKNIELLSDTHYDYLMVVPGKKKKNIVKNELYRNGYLIFQNKASVVPVELLNPQEDDLIWDMCAAPGMKTQLIAQKSKNTAHIIASDYNVDRIATMLSIFETLGSKNMFILNCDSINPPFREDIQFDKISLDPPCTGSGTFSSSPEIKWRQNFSFLNQNVKLQDMLLTRSVDYLRKGGILVYSTCSLYFEEGEAQILKIIKHFKPQILPKWISPSYRVDGKPLEGTGRLFPSIHQSQGFFVAKLRKEM